MAARAGRNPPGITVDEWLDGAAVDLLDCLWSAFCPFLLTPDKLAWRLQGSYQPGSLHPCSLALTCPLLFALTRFLLHSRVQFGAPKGVAALYIRRGVQIERLLCGGGQEFGRRAGTESVLLLAGLGAAAAIVSRELPATAAHMAALRDSLQQQLLAGLPAGVARVNGPAEPAARLPNTLSIGILGIQASSLLAELSERLAASAGAACHSSGSAVSSVLRAMGVPTTHAVGTLRLSVGRHTTQADVDAAVQMILEYVRRQLQHQSDSAA